MPRRPLPRRRTRARWAWVAAGTAVLLAALLARQWLARPGAGAPAAVVPVAADASAMEQPAPVERLRVEVVRVLPHDPAAFTQGLVWNGRTLYESTGLLGRSSLREVELETGRVLRRVSLPPDIFGEGLAQVGERLVQLSWQNGLALVWDAATFERRGEHRYAGEGWGLCYDGRRLVMSDGSSTLAFRDPATFAETSRLQVTHDNDPLANLNELECAGGSIYANVWQTDDIVRIDPASGRVTAHIDARGLLGPAERAGVDVLNGIAYRPETGTFLVTGKLWPKLFEVRFVPR
jgi:glutamine cyclotransferase